MRRLIVPLVLLFITAPPAAGKNVPGSRQRAKDVLSADFQTCFGPDAPLNAESYACLDREYRRLDALLTDEYRAALSRQPDDHARARLTQDERKWWGMRFKHCREEVGDLRGSTAAVINQNCEIDALADRITALRRYGR